MSLVKLAHWDYIVVLFFLPIVSIMINAREGLSAMLYMDGMGHGMAGSFSDGWSGGEVKEKRLLR